MDTVTLSAIASITVSLLVPYLKTVAEGIAKKSGEEIGKAAGEAAWSKAKQLYNAVRAKFASKPDAKEVLDKLEKSPNDKECQTEVENQLTEIMSSDKAFAEEIIVFLEEADSAGADTIFNTNIHGKVQKVVQIGVVKGDVNI